MNGSIGCLPFDPGVVSVMESAQACAQEKDVG